MACAGSERHVRQRLDLAADIVVHPVDQRAQLGPQAAPRLALTAHRGLDLRAKLREGLAAARDPTGQLLSRLPLQRSHLPLHRHGLRARRLGGRGGGGGRRRRLLRDAREARGDLRDVGAELAEVLLHLRQLHQAFSQSSRLQLLLMPDVFTFSHSLHHLSLQCSTEQLLRNLDEQVLLMHEIVLEGLQGVIAQSPLCVQFRVLRDLCDPGCRGPQQRGAQKGGARRKTQAGVGVRQHLPRHDRGPGRADALHGRRSCTGVAALRGIPSQRVDRPRRQSGCWRPRRPSPKNWQVY
mmetsp:Transcript_36329/g.92572  ORF Transcript_36329/g.92572 Transcript_36329/m.92572 type:complete len:295 (-) Transcript_36329:134-1018(-)